jgi:hypothetical protein
MIPATAAKAVLLGAKIVFWGVGLLAASSRPAPTTASATRTHQRPCVSHWRCGERYRAKDALQQLRNQPQFAVDTGCVLLAYTITSVV